MNPKIQEKITELKNDKLHGASWLSIQAIHIVSLATKETSAATVTELLNELQTVTAAIIEARPSMVSIANSVSQLLYQITLISQGEKQLDNAKNAALSKESEFTKLIQEATRKTAENGSKIINDLDFIMTCSYSSTVCTCLKIAQEQAIKFDVLIAESRYNDTAYGEISAKELRKHQIPSTIISDKDIKRYMYKANKALVGADTIRNDGSLVNGAPTYQLAQAASNRKVPLYSICETAKFAVRTQYTTLHRVEPGFDIIPPNLITGIITEVGMIKPSEVTNLRGGFAWDN